MLRWGVFSNGIFEITMLINLGLTTVRKDIGTSYGYEYDQ